MNEANTKRLFSTYPMLFRNQHESSIQHGFECGDGWFDLVYQLARDIETAARERGLKPDDQNWPLCRQVKEKFGSLRFIVFAIEGQPELSDRISELRHQAQASSLHICQQCHAPK